MFLKLMCGFRRCCIVHFVSYVWIFFVVCIMSSLLCAVVPHATVTNPVFRSAKTSFAHTPFMHAPNKLLFGSYHVNDAHTQPQISITIIHHVILNSQMGAAQILPSLGPSELSPALYQCRAEPELQPFQHASLSMISDGNMAMDGMNQTPMYPSFNTLSLVRTHKKPHGKAHTRGANMRHVNIAKDDMLFIYFSSLNNAHEFAECVIWMMILIATQSDTKLTCNDNWNNAQYHNNEYISSDNGPMQFYADTKMGHRIKCQ